MNSPKQPAAAVAPQVIICDDHIAIRGGVIQILEGQQIAAVGCDTVAALVRLVRQHRAAVVITDLAVDGVPFPLLMEKLGGRSMNCRVVVYSMREAPATVGLCYGAGALAFVPKRAEPEEIIKAVQMAAKGERYYPPAVAAELASFHVIDKHSPSKLLTERELRIFMAYARGDSAGELAEQCDASKKTIQNSLGIISQKLGVPRTQFHLLASQHGLLEFD